MSEIEKPAGERREVDALKGRREMFLADARSLTVEEIDEWERAWCFGDDGRELDAKRICAAARAWVEQRSRRQKYIDSVGRPLSPLRANQRRDAETPMGYGMWNPTPSPDTESLCADSHKSEISEPAHKDDLIERLRKSVTKGHEPTDALAVEAAEALGKCRDALAQCRATCEELNGLLALTQGCHEKIHAALRADLETARTDVALGGKAASDFYAELAQEASDRKQLGILCEEQKADLAHWKAIAQAHNDSLVERIKEVFALRAEVEQLKTFEKNNHGESSARSAEIAAQRRCAENVQRWLNERTAERDALRTEVERLKRCPQNSGGDCPFGTDHEMIALRAEVERLTASLKLGYHEAQRTNALLIAEVERLQCELRDDCLYKKESERLRDEVERYKKANADLNGWWQESRAEVERLNELEQGYLTEAQLALYDTDLSMCRAEIERLKEQLRLAHIDAINESARVAELEGALTGLLKCCDWTPSPGGAVENARAALKGETK